ncbi:MAG TPA: TolC family protein, partial [Gemmatimonadaceae bacterium]|nr:TolC family protein [Gemmatimonadaceae bacterium]
RDAARARDRAFGARLLPQLSLSGTMPLYDRSIIPVVQPDGTTLFTPLQRTEASMGLTVSQKLPFSGGTLSVSSSLDRMQVTGAQEVRTWSSTPVFVTLQQDLLRPNETRWDMRAQDVRLDLAEQQYLESREDVALGTANAFFDLFTAQTALHNAVTNAAVNDTLYRLNKGRFEVGKIGENDLLQSELALLRARSAAEGAKLDYDRALSQLRLTLNVPADAPLEIVEPATVPQFDPDTALAVAQALENRSQERSLQLQRVQAQRSLAEARLNNGVGASVQASFGLNASAPEMAGVYRDLLQAQRFSLGVQMPVWQWGVRGAEIQASEADLRSIESSARASRNQAALDARYAALQLSQSRRTLAISAKADTVAGKRFEVAYNRYVIGKIGIDNLYIAQTEKDQAVQQYLEALRGYWTAYYRLRRVTLYDFEKGARIE